MYEKLISSLRICQGMCKGSGFEEAAKLLTQAADAIESTNKAYQMISEAYEAEVTKQNWIPVTERLPEAERKSYWVCTDTGYQCECRWTNNRFGIRESDEWGWSIFDIPHQKVVAWMPLPKPYEPPKEEE